MGEGGGEERTEGEPLRKKEERKKTEIGREGRRKKRGIRGREVHMYGGGRVGGRLSSVLDTCLCLMEHPQRKRPMQYGIGYRIEVSGLKSQYFC